MRRIMIDLERCEGCMSCELACAGEHSQDGDGFAHRTETRIFVESREEEPVPVFCRHCEEPACVQACITGAMRKDPQTGLVDNNRGEQDCIGCWMCIMACPYGVIEKQEDEGGKRAVKCDGCPDREIPACVEACPNEALQVVKINECAGNRRDRAVKTI